MDQPNPLLRRATALLLLLLGGISTTGCVATEPFIEGDYYVQNNLTESLTVEATRPFDAEPLTLLEDVVPPGETVHIYHLVTAAGLEPSGFLETFTVRVGADVVYEGVVDADWSNETGVDYVLTLDP